MLGIWAAALLFLVVSLAAVHTERSRLQTIGKDAVPSVIAAQKLKVSLSDLDANVVNELLVPAGQSADSVKGYVADREGITDSLISAAENITYGDKERIPIRNLTNALSAYERLAIKARTLHQRGDERGATATYNDALVTLHSQLLPAADALSRANADAMHDRDNTLAPQGTLLAAVTLVASLALLAVLLVVQVLLSQRMRRTFSPGLVAATVMTVAVAVLTQRCLADAREQVRSARDDAFQSLSALWQARAVAYDENSDESRWLFVDKNHRDALQQAFLDKTASLLRVPAGDVAAASSALRTSGNLPAGSTGYFADELKNITFPGEQEAATAAVETFSTYFANDSRLRELDNSGQHAAAVRFDMSMNPGDSNWSFVQFDSALGKTIDINQAAFDSAIDQGFGEVRPMDALLPGAIVAVGLCSFAGLMPRLREYRR
jgi:hypothetical protein